VKISGVTISAKRLADCKEFLCLRRESFPVLHILDVKEFPISILCSRIWFDIKLLSNLMFMGPCIVIIFQYINPNKMHKWLSLFNLTTALHVSGVTITHLQEHKTTVSSASGNRYTVLLSAAIVEEFERLPDAVVTVVLCSWRWAIEMDAFQLFHDSSRQQYGVTVTR